MPEMTTPPSSRRRVATALLAAPWHAGMTPTARAQTYPSKPIRIVVPYPPGGFNDTLGRIVASKLGDTWKVPVFVDNRPGAGTTIGTQIAAAAPTDGYTLLVIQFPFATNPWLYKLPYDSERAFVPVVLAGRSPMLLVTHVHSPWQTVGEVIAAARANPGGINYGTSGPGSSNHLGMVLFENIADVRMNQIPYKGSTPMLTDLAGGQFDLAVDLLPQALPFIQGGRVRPLAIADRQRSERLPDVPTAAQVGMAGWEAAGWHGFVVPTGTPQPVVQTLNRAINRVLTQATVQETFISQGVIPDGGTPEQFRQFIAGQMQLWRRIITQYQITAE